MAKGKTTKPRAKKPKPEQKDPQVKEPISPETETESESVAIEELTVDQPATEPEGNADKPKNPELEVDSAEDVEADSDASEQVTDAEQPDEVAEIRPEGDVDDEDAPGDNAPDAVPPQEPQRIIERRAGFFPMLLGGVAAAAIGFGMARYVLPEGWPWPGTKDDGFETEIRGKLSDQAKAVADLRGGIPAPVDLSDVNNRINAATKGNADLIARLDALDTRLNALEKRPMTDGASPQAVLAYERELKKLQAAVAKQRAEIEAMAKAATDSEASAKITAQEAMKRAALSRIITAIDTGNGFAEPLEELAKLNVAVPAELNKSSAGVPTVAALADAFPPAARAALAEARKSSGGGFGAFLKRQMGARSLTPKEGNSADAILSRAEAAVKEGRLRDALAEIEALPDGAKAKMAQWVTDAGARLDALAGADALSQLLNKN